MHLFILILNTQTCDVITVVGLMYRATDEKAEILEFRMGIQQFMSLKSFLSGFDHRTVFLII